jgi:hypothetical protein
MISLPSTDLSGFGSASTQLASVMDGAQRKPETFADLVERFSATEAGEKQVATIREESRKLVAEAFITPILAKIRENNQAAAPFGTTDAEKRFGPIYDRAVADSMSRPDSFPMVESVERYMLRRIVPQREVIA